MASPTSAAFTHSGEWISQGVYVTTWTVTVSGAGLAESAPYLPDKTVTIEGVTGGTSGITIQGCNATTPTGSYYTLKSGVTGGTLSAITTENIYQIAENPRWIRPLVTTATKTSGITVRMVSR